MPAIPEPSVSKHGLSSIMPRCSRHPATRMSARAAQIKTLERHPVICSADHRAGAEQLVEAHLAMEDVAADQSKATFKVEWRMDLAAEHRLCKSRCMGIDSRNDLVGGIFPLLVPASTRSEIVPEMLAKEAGDVLAP